METEGNVTWHSPLDGQYNNNAMGVGGGTSVYGAQAWRFKETDFRMASHYGVPAGSSLADWPINLADLLPHYEAVENELGVSGGRGGTQSWPMPPTAPTLKGERLAAAASRLGWDTQAVPLTVNSIPYGGRPACTNCQHCVGFACPVDAKNGTQNTYIPRAIATGRAELRIGVQVVHIETTNGIVTGVTAVVGGQTQSFRADRVIVASGAIESARLLLVSEIGTAHDQVGRNLQGHYYAVAAGITPESVYDGVGPGPSVATLKWSHDNEGIIGGGMLADDFVLLPIIYAKRALPPGAPRWGQDWKDFVRENYRRTLQVMGPIQDIPTPESRVKISSSERDDAGMPRVVLAGVAHPESPRAQAFLLQKAKEWLAAAGAEQIWGGVAGRYLSAGQHQAGTCRMGDDPATSVVDAGGKVHGFANVWVTDASVHVTNGGFNPFLTAMATARRTALGIASTG
jgi:choline dehydrogenase-like flavoprotein